MSFFEVAGEPLRSSNVTSVLALVARPELSRSLDENNFKDQSNVLTIALSLSRIQTIG